MRLHYILYCYVIRKTTLYTVLSCNKGDYIVMSGGGLMICHFSIIEVHFVFCQFNFIVLFPFLIKYYHILFIIIVFWLGCDRPSGLVLFVPLCFFPCSRLSSYYLRLSLCLISFLLFPCVSVWENTRA